MGNWWVIGLFDKVLTLNKVWGNSGNKQISSTSFAGGSPLFPQTAQLPVSLVEVV